MIHNWKEAERDGDDYEQVPWLYLFPLAQVGGFSFSRLCLPLSAAVHTTMRLPIPPFDSSRYSPVTAPIPPDRLAKVNISPGQISRFRPDLPWVEDDSRKLVAWVDVWPVILPKMCEKSARCLAFDLAGMCSRDKDKMLTPVELVAVLKGLRNMVCQRLLRQINKPMARPLA